MRLPTLVVLLSSAAYAAACGSSDESKAEPDGGAAGATDGGESPSVGGSQNAAGTRNAGGSPSASAGEGNDGEGGASGHGAAAGVGAGGEPSPDAAGGMDASGGMGAGGESNSSLDVLPEACPGAFADYTRLVGTDGDDTFTTPDVNGQKLIFGLDGVDTFPAEHGGQDCLVGGPGNDDFTNSDEFANYYYGGSGDDTYHVDTAGNFVHIADFAAGDRIALSLATYPLTGTPGEPASSAQVVSVPGFSSGTSTASEATVIVYDPETGELWRDVGGGTKDDGSAAVILTIVNKSSYVFDINDFIVE